MPATAQVKLSSPAAGERFPRDGERRSLGQGAQRSLRPVMRAAVEDAHIDQKVVAIDLDVSPNYWTRMLSLTAEQKTFDLDKLLLLPVPVFKAFVRRLAVVAGLAVVEPDARLEAVSEAMAALTRVIDTLAADSTLPARSSGQLKAGLE